MEFVEFIAKKNDSDRRLDKLIKILLPNMPLSVIYKNIRTGFIRINGKKAKNEQHINENDVVGIEIHLNNTYSLENKSSTKNENQNSNQELITKCTIFQNENILILNKPYDLPVQQSASTENSLDEIVKSIYIKNSLSFVPGPLHRIDRQTTGAICFSQNLDCARWFQEQMMEHKITKTYLALVEGNISSETSWIDYLKKDDTSNYEKNAFHKSVISNETDGKKAITNVMPLSHGKYQNKEITLALFQIPTGRNHQIRLQSSIHNHPIVGDVAYNSTIKQIDGIKQKFFLHCYSLEFPKNDFNIPEKVFAELSNDFDLMLKKCLIEKPKQAYTI